MTSAHDADQPDFLTVLGLAKPVSLEDVRQAYFEKAKTAHPDRGGSVEQFLALEQAFERASEYARFHAKRTVWLASSVERYVEQQALLDEVRRLGGTARLEELDWLKDTIGSDFAQMLDQIVELDFRGRPIDDGGLRWLGEHQAVLPALRHLDLAETAITDRGLAHLAALRSLRSLDLSGTPVSSGAVALARMLPALERLRIADTRLGWVHRLRLRWRCPQLVVDRSRRRG